MSEEDVLDNEAFRVLILEAFSEQLHASSGRGLSSEEILHQWLLDILCQPRIHGDHISQVIHTEIRLQNAQGETRFQGASATGQRLLDSLYEYCKSYDNWQFSRWLHHLRASDFPPSLL